jgi:hypothetical protein
MNKILRYSLVCLLTLICGSIFATDVTFTAGTDVPGSDATTLTKDGITLTIGIGTAQSAGTLNGVTAATATKPAEYTYRIYKSNTFTISSSVGNITKIVFNCTASGTTKWGPGCFAALDGYTPDGTVGTWAGTAASSVSFTASTNQVRATSIVVTVGAEDPNFVAAPTITGNAEFETTDEVSIAGAEGTNVYYTTDGTDPTTASTKYTAPFSINATTTVKAIAEKNGNLSAVATSTFTKIAFEPFTLTGLKALSGDRANVEITFKNALVTYVDGTNIYLREGDNAIILFGTALKMTAGQRVNGSARFNYLNYYGIPELKDKTGFTNDTKLTLTTSTEAVQPVIASVAGLISSEHVADLINVTGTIVKDGSNYYISDGTNKVQLFSKARASLYTSLTDFTKIYSVNALFNNIYKSAPEIDPISIEEATTPVDNHTTVGDNSVPTVTVVYNLGGQRLSAPQKGVNIINGKKVMNNK